MAEVAKGMPDSRLREELSAQLKRALRYIHKADLDRLIVAYEPHWAIWRRFEAAVPVERVGQSVEAIRAALGCGG